MNPTNRIPVIFTYCETPNKQLGENASQGLGDFPQYCHNLPRKTVLVLQCEGTFDVQHLVCFV